MDGEPLLIDRPESATVVPDVLGSGRPVVIASARSNGTWGVSPRVLRRRLDPRVVVIGIRGGQTLNQVKAVLCEAGRVELHTYGGAVRAVDASGGSEVFLCYPGDDRLRVVEAVRRWLACREAEEVDAGRVQRLQDKVTALTREREDLRQTVVRLRRELDQVREAESVRDERVYADPDQQLRHEVWLTHLHEVAEQDRSPLPRYRICPELHDDLEQDLISRSRVLTVMVEVLTGSVWDKHARGVHQLRVNEGGGSATVVREDGAVAWRAALKRGSPGAPRLMWWVGVDGSIDFARAAHHDDYRMPSPAIPALAS